MPERNSSKISPIVAESPELFIAVPRGNNAAMKITMPQSMSSYASLGLTAPRMIVASAPAMAAIGSENQGRTLRTMTPSKIRSMILEPLLTTSSGFTPNCERMIISASLRKA